MPKTWTAVIVETVPELADGIASLLIDLGAPGLVTEDTPSSTTITAHFENEAPLKAIERYCGELPQLFPGFPAPEIRTERVEESAWAENWKDHFPPLRVGKSLFVHPPWVTDVPPDRSSIVIDPGMAFGTGHHATTLGCLTLLEQTARAVPVRRVLDIGVGSGILAIAAARLGAVEVIGTDNDPDACRVAEENVAINGVADRVRIASSLDDLPAPFDVVLVNILAGDLVALAGRISLLLRPGGTAIGSGFLASEEALVTSAWNHAGLEPEARFEDTGWVAVACRRR